MRRIAPDFAPLLDGIELEALESSETLALGLREDLSIAFINQTWIDTGADNSQDPEFAATWGLGANYLEAIHGRAREYFRKHLDAVFESGETWVHDYRCPSVDALMTARIEVRCLGNCEGLLLLHSWVDKRPLPPAQADWTEDVEASYRNEAGVVVQCCHCRRLRAVDDSEWYWVPAAIQNPPADISHGICDECFERFY